MNINEFHTFNIKDAVKFHKELNPKIFNPNNKMDPEVRDQLLVIAKDFITELGVSDLDVEDITISGSNAAYSYTDHSDLDLHILVDHSKLPDDEVYKELFNAKKTLYNDNHDITVRGIPVELYVQDSNQPHITLGEYSLIDDKWLRIPTKDKSNFNQNETKVKYEKLLDLISRAIKSKDSDKVNKAWDNLKRYRKAGLESAGEFGPENLAYKALRNQGLVQKLYDVKNELHSKKLSIESAMDEDYDPNGPPPGPEFKPTMPAGTVRVDVSDVYDWYKLGQNISNLDKVDKSQFGKGPPSTIMAFGSEELEHKYINALKQLGLDTTDIDPVDKNQPKGMPRQKVDPTYNVNEILDTKPGKTNKAEWYYGDPSMITLDFVASNEQPYTLSFLDVGLAPDLIDPYEMLPDANDQYYDNGYFVEFEQKHKRDPFKQGKQGIEGTGAAAEVFGIVTNAILQFVKKKKATYLYFQAAEDSRISLYSALVKKLLPSLPGWKSVGPNSDGVFMLYSPVKKVTKEASGYIPSEKEKNDPRFKTALTVDVKPDSIKKNAKAFGFKVTRAGIPPLLRD